MQRTIYAAMGLLGALALTACLGAPPAELRDDTCLAPNDCADTGVDDSDRFDVSADAEHVDDVRVDAPAPCESKCPLDLCDVETDTCNECARDTDCGDGVCEAGSCVECRSDEQCTEGVCSDDLRCVECQGDVDCETGVCDSMTESCVECVENEDCPDPAAPRCDATMNVCTSCTESAHCDHIPGAGVCDAATESCVECLDQSETRTACSGNSCNPATSTCTQTLVGSRNVCEPCLADSECGRGLACVLMKFNGTLIAADEGFCLPRAEAATDCKRPFRVFGDRETLSDPTPSSICALSESMTSCRAYLDLVRDVTCLDASACGLANTPDGECFGGHCTLPCQVEAQCPESMRCDTTLGLCRLM